MFQFIVKIVLTLILLASCSSKKPDGKTAAEVLYKEAQDLIKDKRYILATEKLNEIKTQHPYSFYATPAELLQADVLFKQENFIEAAAAYLIFRDYHPKHEQIAYVIFQIAESYYKQAPDTIDRDLEPAYESLKYYKEIVEKYPSSVYKADALNRMKSAMEMLRSKDKYIADFYFKTEKFSAARYWYLDMLVAYDNQAIRNHAILGVLKSSLRLKEKEECLNYSEKYSQEVEKEYHKELKSVQDQCQKL